MALSAAYFFCGLGGMAIGAKRAGFETVAAFDVDPESLEDFRVLTGDEAVELDLGTCSPEDVRRRSRCRPDVVFTSPPCKGFSGCLPAARSKTAKYVALNSLAERGIWLALEAWETPPPLIVMENVPRIMSRGREWLDRVIAMLHAYGYAVRETTHDCGELGGLAQHRRRYLLVARHMEQCPEFLHEPPVRRVRAIGEVFAELPVPLPGEATAGPMHRLPRLSPLNWVRLALIPAGGDWRDLPSSVELHTRSGRQNGGYGVEDWRAGSHAVIAEGSVRNTRASIADPRVECIRREGGHGVKIWDEASAPVISAPSVHNWPAGVADPRVADGGRYRGAYGVQDLSEPAATVRGAHEPRLAPSSIADPRLTHDTRPGTMGVRGWATPSHVVIGDARAYKGHAVADPRVPEIHGAPLDLDSQRPTWLVIRAADGTWHRPMTTLELAALQGFPTQVGDKWLVLEGRSHKRWRQRIGNAVPPPAAEAIARECADTLAASGASKFRLCAEPVWVSNKAEVQT